MGDVSYARIRREGGRNVLSIEWKGNNKYQEMNSQHHGISFVIRMGFVQIKRHNNFFKLAESLKLVIL